LESDITERYRLSPYAFSISASVTVEVGGVTVVSPVDVVGVDCGVVTGVVVPVIVVTQRLIRGCAIKVRGTPANGLVHVLVT